MSLRRNSLTSVRASISRMRDVIRSSSSFWTSWPRFSQKRSFLGVESGAGAAWDER